MRSAALLAFTLLLTLGLPAGAVIGAIDNVPAATLLLPYFEVDLKDPQGVNTLFSINNAAATPVLAKVVLWSDQGVAVADFNVYLTGYDVQTISLRDILVQGNLPVTNPVGFPTCTGHLPYVNPAISSADLAHYQAWLTGAVSPATGTCAGSDVGDGHARGYATVDTVNACNVLFPGAQLYPTTLTHQNVLWGDWLLADRSKDIAHGDMLVHIESCPACLAPGDHTFYGSYYGGLPLDGREPLPTTWAARYVNGGGFSGGTDLIVWREVNRPSFAYPCKQEGPSNWYPLEAAQILAFDETGLHVDPDSCGLADPGCDQDVLIPNTTQRIHVAPALETPYSFGWLYLSLQHPIPAYGDNAAQSWVIVLMNADSMGAGFDVLQLDNANAPAVPLP
jgi:hypothetical protein